MDIYDTIIIGGGPAGVGAGIYAARKKIKALLITENFGGQSAFSANIENWIGTKSITGLDFSSMLEKHLRAQEGIEVRTEEKIIEAKKLGAGFQIVSSKGKIYEAATLLVASGGRRRELWVKGEREFKGKGVCYCSTCDAPLFRRKNVAVVGGGEAGLEAVRDLSPYAAKIYLLIRENIPAGDYATFEKIKYMPNVHIIFNAEVKEIFGKNFVSGLKYSDTVENKILFLEVAGIFVEVGTMPNSEFLKDLVKTDDNGEIIVDCRTGRTSQEGIFAAGDVTDEFYKQNNIAAGDGIKAILSIDAYLGGKMNKKKAIAHKKSVMKDSVGRNIRMYEEKIKFLLSLALCYDFLNLPMPVTNFNSADLL